MIGSRFIANIAILGCLLVGACAAPKPTTTVSGDGDYRGTATRVHVLKRNCQRPGLLFLNVRNGTMYYRWEGQYVPVSVLSNGTVSGSLPNGVRVAGTHDGTTIRGDVTDGLCTLHFTVRRVGT